MASNRHLGRIIALQTLYEYDFRERLGDETAKIDEILARNLERYEDRVDDKEFVRRLVMGVNKAGRQLDAIIAPVAPDWPLNQIAIVDRDVCEWRCLSLVNLAVKYHQRWRLMKQLN